MLQNRHLRQAAGRYGQIKQRRPERAKGLATCSDKKIVLLYFKSGVQNPLKKTGRHRKAIRVGTKFKKNEMAQEMYKHDALLHLLWAVATADTTSDDQKFGNAVSSLEDEYYEKVNKAEGIDIPFSEIVLKRTALRDSIGYDGIIKEALKATNSCGKEWKAKVIVYMIKMSHKSWGGDYQVNGEKINISDSEWKIITKAKKYFGLTEEEEKKGWDLTKI